MSVDTSCSLLARPRCCGWMLKTLLAKLCSLSLRYDPGSSAQSASTVRMTTSLALSQSCEGDHSLSRPCVTSASAG